MSSVRNDVDFEGIGLQTATFKFDDSIVYDETLTGRSAQLDLAVTMKGDKTVGLAGDGERITGKLIVVEKDGCCTVVIGGGVTFKKGTGATVTAGLKIVGDTGGAGGAIKGYVRNVNLAGAINTAFVTELQNACHEIYDTENDDRIQVFLDK